MLVQLGRGAFTSMSPSGVRYVRQRAAQSVRRALPPRIDVTLLRLRKRSGSLAAAIIIAAASASALAQEKSTSDTARHLRLSTTPQLRWASLDTESKREESLVPWLQPAREGAMPLVPAFFLGSTSDWEHQSLIQLPRSLGGFNLSPYFGAQGARCWDAMGCDDLRPHTGLRVTVLQDLFVAWKYEQGVMADPGVHWFLVGIYW